MSKVDKTAKDEDQRLYRDYFNITDMYLIQYCYDPNKKGDDKDGYIIFIDYDYDLDYVDLRNNDGKASEISRAIAKLQLAEAVPTKHLPKNIQLEFKRSLGIGYIHALNCQFEDIPEIINNAQKYLKERNREFSRWLFLGSGFPAVIFAFLAGFLMYINDYFQSLVFWSRFWHIRCFRIHLGTLRQNQKLWIWRVWATSFGVLFTNCNRNNLLPHSNDSDKMPPYSSIDSTE